MDKPTNGNVLTWRVDRLEAAQEEDNKLRERLIKAEGKVSNLEKSVGEISETLKSINLWLRGVMGSLILALVLLAFNLMNK